MNGGRHINDGELEAIYTLYDALQLADNSYYDNWVANVGNSLVDKYIVRRAGIEFVLDSLTNTFRVASLELSQLPDRNDLVLPDVFDKFEFLESFTLHVPSTASISLPVALFDCPLKQLTIVCDSITAIKGSIPPNYGNLAPTIEYLKFEGTTLGNDLLKPLPNFTKLKECHLRKNNLTGKTPFFSNYRECYYYFDGNEFTEFDWKYMETYQDFETTVYNKPIMFPRFVNNNISGPLPSYINDDFFATFYEKKDVYRPGYFFYDVFRYNPIYKEYKEAETKGYAPFNITIEWGNECLEETENG